MQDEEESRDGTLEGLIIMDVGLILLSHLTPEQHIDVELAHVKKAMLEQFYRRFPDQRPTGDEDAKG